MAIELCDDCGGIGQIMGKRHFEVCPTCRGRCRWDSGPSVPAFRVEADGDAGLSMKGEVMAKLLCASCHHAPSGRHEGGSRCYCGCHDAADGVFELLKAATAAECSCSVAERFSGHKVGCWLPALAGEIAVAKGRLDIVEVPLARQASESKGVDAS